MTKDIKAIGRVEVACGVAKERIKTVGRVVARSVASERINPGVLLPPVVLLKSAATPLAVLFPGGVVKERFDTVGSVEAACCVAIECLKTGRRVVVAVGVAKKRIKPVGRVVAADGVAKERRYPVGGVLVAGAVVLERLKTVGRVVAAGGIVNERLHTGGRVAVAGGVAKERKKTDGRVAVANGVVSERENTDGRVVDAGRVVLKRYVALGCIVPAGGVVKERIRTDGGITRAGCQGKKRIITLGGIAAGIASVGCRNNPESSRGRRKCKRTKRNATRMEADRERRIVRSELWEVITVFMVVISFVFGLSFLIRSQTALRHSLEGSAVEGASHSTRLVTHGVTRLL